ncbi:MAG TPA: TolC family protein [Rhizobiaceae bacterium]|nr:TolC family protein [Rhizobiaceae bacterium]
MREAAIQNRGYNSVSAKRVSWSVSAAGLVLAMLASGCAVTPQALTPAELSAAADREISTLAVDQEPVTQPIGLYEAMARALKYNLDHRVEMMQVALAQKQLASATADMLPRLVASGGYAGRDKVAASFSETLTTGLRSSSATFSSEKVTLSGDLTFSWHVLDFRLSWVRAHQAADKALIAEETKRRIVNRIIEDVRIAYWRAVSAERLLDGFRKLESRIVKTQADTRAIRRAGQTSPVAALTYERELVDIKREINRLENTLTTARHQLAALMNVRPGDRFSLVAPKRDVSEVSVRLDGADMVRVALTNRPEFREILYKGRINEKEAEVALLEILPGLSAYGGINADSNDFLVNSNWLTWGAQASWNVMRVFQYPTRKAAVDANAQLIGAQARAMTMAIVTQVHVARARYQIMRKTAATAAEYYNVQRDLRDQLRAGGDAGAVSEQTLIREEMNTLVAAVEFDIAYADLQNAFAAIYSTLGIDPWDEQLSTAMSIDELAATLRRLWRERGDLHG